MKRYKQRRFNASDNSRVLLELRSQTACALQRAYPVQAQILESRSGLPIKRHLELRIGAIDLVNEKHGGLVAQDRFNNGRCNRKRFEKKTSSSFASLSAASVSDSALPSVSLSLSRSNWV